MSNAWAACGPSDFVKFACDRAAMLSAMLDEAVVPALPASVLCKAAATARTGPPTVVARTIVFDADPAEGCDVIALLELPIPPLLDGRMNDADSDPSPTLPGMLLVLPSADEDGIIAFRIDVEPRLP